MEYEWQIPTILRHLFEFDPRISSIKKKKRRPQNDKKLEFFLHAKDRQLSTYLYVKLMVNKNRVSASRMMWPGKPDRPIDGWLEDKLG